LPMNHYQPGAFPKSSLLCWLQLPRHRYEGNLVASHLVLKRWLGYETIFFFPLFLPRRCFKPHESNAFGPSWFQTPMQIHPKFEV
jgi:hypothetical protein